MGMVKKTASIVSSLIVILAIGGFVFVRNFDLNRYKGYIEELALRETGRKLSLNGDAKIGLSLIPTLVINDVTFANPDWAQNPYMARLSKLEVQFSLGALLRKQIDIKKFILIKPEIYLETSKDGKNNWTFTQLAPQGAVRKNTSSQPTKIKEASAVAAVGMIAKEVKLEGGKVIYYDGKSKATTDIMVNEVNFEADNGKPIKLELDAAYNQYPLTAEMQLSNIQTIIQTANVDFEGTLNFAKIKSDLRGTIKNVTGNPEYTLETDIHNPAGNFNMPESSLLSRIDGDLSKAEINIRSLNIATNLITGNVKADWSKAKPYIVADLRSDVFNVKSLSKNSMLSDNSFNFINEANALEMVPAEKIPYQYLNEVNGDFNIKIGKLILDNDIVLMDLLLKAKLNGGVLNFAKLNTTTFGGTVALNGVVNANKQSISANINANNLKFGDLYSVLVDDDDFIILNGGLLDVRANLNTTGATYRKCSENLDGQFIALINKSVFKSGHIEWLSEGLMGELFKLLSIDVNKQAEMNLECAVLNSKIKDGKAVFNKGIVFNADKLQLVSSGNLNLVNDKIDFTISPTLNKLSSGNLTQALASFIRLSGTLQKPSIKLDKTSAVSTVVGTIATNGLYLGGEVLLGGDDNLCNTALQGTEFASRFPKQESVKNSVKESYQDVAEQARDAAKEIGNAAKGIFKSFKNTLKGK